MQRFENVPNGMKAYGQTMLQIADYANPRIKHQAMVASMDCPLMVSRD